MSDTKQTQIKTYYPDTVVGTCYLSDGEYPPGYLDSNGKRHVNSGWRVLDGNMHGNTWARVIAPHEVIDQTKYHLEELIAQIQEHQAMPCKSLETRMYAGAAAAARYVENEL